MINKDKDTGVFNIICNECHNNIVIDTVGDFKKMLTDIKEKGWRMKPDDQGKWEHYCPDCVREWASKQPKDKYYK